MCKTEYLLAKTRENRISMPGKSNAKETVTFPSMPGFPFQHVPSPACAD